MVERLLCMQEAQGSIPCSSTLFLSRGFAHCERRERATTRGGGKREGGGLPVAVVGMDPWVGGEPLVAVVGALAQW